MAGARSTAERMPSPDLSLDQVLAFIRKLDSTARSQVARVLAESEMDTRFGALIQRLAQKAPVEVPDREIQAEVDAVRLARLRTPC